MRVVTVTRKPFEGSTTSNVVEHSCGALNIEATRIKAPALDRQDYGLHNKPLAGLTGEVYGSWEAKRDDYQRPEAGRWPANLVILHLSSCRRLGVLEVRGDSRAFQGGKRPGGFAGTGGDKGDGRPGGPMYEDQDGLERVPSWECVEGCPVAALDRQSGFLQSGVGTVKRASSKDQEGNRSSTFGAESRPEGTPWVSYGDGGGASRFFKQFVSQGSS